MAPRFAWLFLAVSCSGDKGGGTGEDRDDPEDEPGVDPPTPQSELPACADGAIAAAPGWMSGTTVGGGDDTPATCDLADPLNLEDAAIAFVAPTAGTWAFTTLRSMSDPILAVYDGCGGPQLGCSVDHALKGLVTVELAAGQLAIAVLDGGDDYVLDVFEVQPTEIDCADGRDDDADRAPDCLDPDCADVPSCAPVCPDLRADGAPARIWSDTIGATDDDLPKCGVGYVVEPTSDTSVSFTAPDDGLYAVDVTGHGFQPNLAVLDGCGGRELGCSQGTPIALSLSAGQSIVAVVDGWYWTPEGAFSVDFWELEADESDCADGRDNDLRGGADCADPACDADPSCAEDCGNGADDDGDFAVDCADPGCAASCVESRCADARDDDGNGLVDCADPDCDLAPACAEDCADQLDDDLDGAIDCLDGACAGEPRCALDCPDEVLVGERIVGTTVGRPDVWTPSCRTDDRVTSDWSVSFTAPADGRYRFDTRGSWEYGALAILDGCGGPELGCDDPPFGTPSEVVAELVAGQTVIAVLDAAAAVGEFTLNVARVPRVEDACADGVDDDADRTLDCADPDCVAAQACVEDCGDGTDDNGNGLVDCTDPVCAVEARCLPACPEETLDGPLPLEATGSTFGRPAVRASTCGNGAPGPERTWGFVAPEAGTYVFDTLGSSLDTVLSVLDGCGGATLACNDDVSDGAPASRVRVTLEAGQEVLVVVDGYQDPGEFVLNVGF